jgi:signal peptidase I
LATELHGNLQQRGHIMKNKWHKRFAVIFRSWGFSFIVAILVATSFKSAIADWNDIPTGSMEPTILVGDRVIVNKLAYDLKVPYTTLHLAQWANPKRGDIVVFYSPEDEKRLIKRVIGIPGDIVGMKQNRLFVNGNFVQYASIKQDVADQLEPEQQTTHVFFEENLPGKQHAVMFSTTRPSIKTFDPIKIPDGQYFMMGDNRDNSADSRYFGFVERKRIVGRATKVAISRKGSFLHPRWYRFFKELS